MPKKRTDKASPELRVRVSDSLRKKIEDAAAARGHSMNVEITNRLKDTLGDAELLALLRLGWGEDLGELAAQAAAAGILTLTDADIEAILKRARRKLEDVQKSQRRPK